MDQFAHNFIVTMLHSLWQSALLLLFYGIIILCRPRLVPLSKRNILFTLLAIQLFYSAATFYLISSNAAQGLLIAFSDFARPLIEHSWLQSNAALLFFLYIVFVVGKAAFNYMHWTRFKKNYKLSLTKTSLELRLFTQTKAFEFGITRKVFLWCSHAISTPMTFGFWKPVILLPLALVNQLTPQQLEAIIIHELTHIRHKDYLLNWGLVAMETVFCFNPFVRIIAKQIKMEREKNCDVQVLHFKYGNILYAEALLKASQVQQQLSLQLSAVRSRKQLFKRIHFFSKPQSLQFQQGSRSAVLAGYICFMLVTILLAGSLTQQGPETLLLAVPQITTSAKAPVTTESQAAFETRPVLTTQAAVAARLSKKRRPLHTSATPAIAAAPVEIVSEEAVGFLTLPASQSEIVYEGKEIIIKDEGSDGKTITAAYYAVLVDGVWTLQPLWLMTEVKPKADSIITKGKDSAVQIMRIVQ